jgi:uncharacterized membrane protein
MDTYSIVLFIHIAAAIVLVGGSILAAPTIRSAVLRADTLAELRTWLAAGRPLATINPAASFALLGAGLYLTAAGGWWKAAWVQLAIGLWVVNLATATRVVGPAMQQLAVAAAASGDGPVDATVDRLRRTRRWSGGHHVLLANDLGVLYLMISKPGYLGSVSAIAAAHGLLALAPVLYRNVARHPGTPVTPAAPAPVRPETGQ